ncbi:unnamed protein product [Linum trigynum]|uniref:Uncharacterized protein n=1 Tax=Linum trigynum TaxID=586398 RepID=A0AAV2GLB6_9ROSI
MTIWVSKKSHYSNIEPKEKSIPDLAGTGVFDSRPKHQSSENRKDRDAFDPRNLPPLGVFDSPPKLGKMAPWREDGGMREDGVVSSPSR